MPALTTLPDYDLATRSAYGFFLKWVVPRLEPVHLLSVTARKLPFDVSLRQASLVIGAGHGTESELSGQDEDVVLRADSLPDVSGKFFKLLSCQLGVELGPRLIESGAAAFHGYTDDFVWLVDDGCISKPWNDGVAARALMPVIAAVGAILDGKTSQEAFNLEVRQMRENADVEEDDLLKSCIEHNARNAVMLGDPDARVARRLPIGAILRIVSPPPLPPLAGGM